MYADDLVKWLMTLAENANPQCPVYNVGSDKEVEIRTLANIVADIFNISMTCVKTKNNLVDRYIPAVEKANSELGLIAQHELEKALLLSISK